MIGVVVSDLVDLVIALVDALTGTLIVLYDAARELL